MPKLPRLQRSTLVRLGVVVLAVVAGGLWHTWLLRHPVGGQYYSVYPVEHEGRRMTVIAVFRELEDAELAQLATRIPGNTPLTLVMHSGSQPALRTAARVLNMTRPQAVYLAEEPKTALGEYLVQRVRERGATVGVGVPGWVLESMAEEK